MSPMTRLEACSRRSLAGARRLRQFQRLNEPVVAEPHSQPSWDVMYWNDEVDVSEGSFADWLANRVITAIATLIIIGALAWGIIRSIPSNPLAMLVG